MQAYIALPVQLSASSRLAAISSQGIPENTPYNEVAAEVFHGSLWDDDIWQVTDIIEIQQGS